MDSPFGMCPVLAATLHCDNKTWCMFYRIKMCNKTSSKTPMSLQDLLHLNNMLSVCWCVGKVPHKITLGKIIQLNMSLRQNAPCITNNVKWNVTPLTLFSSSTRTYMFICALLGLFRYLYKFTTEKIYVFIAIMCEWWNIAVLSKYSSFVRQIAQSASVSIPTAI